MHTVLGARLAMLDTSAFAETTPPTRAAALPASQLQSPTLAGEAVEVWVRIPGIDPRYEVQQEEGAPRLAADGGRGR
jgi:hypothetical protein